MVLNCASYMYLAQYSCIAVYVRSVNLCDTPLTHLEVISRERILFTVESLSTEQAVYVCVKRIQPDFVL